MLPTPLGLGGMFQGSWLSPINRNWSEARLEIQTWLHWSSCYSIGEPKQVTGYLAHSWTREGGELPYTGWGLGVSRAVEWLKCFAHPFVILCAGGMHSPLLLHLPSWQLFRSGSWAFWSFCIVLPVFCSNCACMQLLSLPIVSLYFVAGGKVCLAVSTGEVSQVPAFLNRRSLRLTGNSSSFLLSCLGVLSASGCL